MNSLSVKGRSRLFVVLNPVAGQEEPDYVRQVLDQAFTQRGLTYQIYETTGSEELSAIVKKSLEQQFDLFVAVGGDGTVAGVAGGLVHRKAPMAILPTGTGNALAIELDLPLAFEEALKLVVDQPSTRSLDLIEVEDRFFTLNLGIGLSADMMRHTERQSKRRFGFLAYIWTGLKGLVGIQPRRFTLIIDGQRHQIRASEVVVLNAGAVGGTPLRWGPHIRPDDGRLDIALVRGRTGLDYIRLVWTFLLGRQNEAPIHFLQAEREVEIDSDRPLMVQADGEVIGQTPVRARLLPDAIRVIVPPSP
jgi:YegS/Rv2252/BmrU family lipid kinase